MKLVSFLVLCLAALHRTNAFAPKKRGDSSTSPTRPAFKNHHTVVKEEVPECTASQTCSTPPSFAFKATTSHAEASVVVEWQDDDLDFDDDVVIGTAAGIVACAVSLALGFSLGYVTL
jgi:hypothetical protein